MSDKTNTDSRSVNVPKELYDWLVEYAVELRGTWSWKENSTHRNCETMTKLDNDIKAAIALRDSPTTSRETEEKRIAEIDRIRYQIAKLQARMEELIEQSPHVQ